MSEDYETQEGAWSLVDTIKAYWAKFGLFPHVWVQTEGINPIRDDRRFFVVRSNMINGRPSK